MPAEMSPKKVQEYMQQGMKRLENFRSARLIFLRNYVGQYYDQDNGEIGNEALNLIFNAIRTLLPNIVMSYPQHNVTAKYLPHREYAEMLSLALSHHDKETDIRSVYRRVIVDAIFTLGILKTGLAESDSVYAFDDYDRIDTGHIYTEAVDFDNFIVDPNSRDHLFRDAMFLGDKMIVPRYKLLESGLYDNELVEALPPAGGQPGHERKSAAGLSMKKLTSNALHDFQDDVEIAELWVPSANAVITVPGAKDVVFRDYLRVDDYYGPNEGPYTLLALTPPVPGNPLPVPAVGIWNDLHTLANRMAKKIIDQAERQKDIVGYRRQAADDAQEALDAGDGEAIAMDDPDALRTYSFGGQQNSNEAHLGQLTGWFNMMSANPNTLAGASMDAESATEAQILAKNANVGLEDMKQLVYTMSAHEARKRAWYMHTDPFINLPLIKREQVPAQYGMTPQGPQMISPARLEDVQIHLTPEARAGDFLDYHFDVEPESMGRKDPQARFQEAMDFAVKIMPAAMSVAQTAMALGLPFSVKSFLIRMAKDRGIDWFDEVFFDPEFQQQIAMQLQMSPQPDGSQGTPGQPQKPQFGQPNANVGQGRDQRAQMQQGNDLLSQIMQNGQPSTVAGNPNLMAQQRVGAQQGAVQGQADLKRGGGY